MGTERERFQLTYDFFRKELYAEDGAKMNFKDSSEIRALALDIRDNMKLSTWHRQSFPANGIQVWIFTNE